MRQINSLEELEFLLASHLARGYFIRLNYELLPPRKAGAGENGETQSSPTAGPQEPLQGNDLQRLSNLAHPAFTVVAFHSRD